MTSTPGLVGDALWERIALLLPPSPPRPRGGRPRLSDREALNGVLFVLKTNIPWEHLPQQLGYGSGMTCWRRLRLWQQIGVWPAIQQVLVEHLDFADRIDWNRIHAAEPPETGAADSVPSARRARRAPAA